MYKNLSLALALIAGIAATAQQASYVDPAQAYNRILVEKGANSYRQVGNYKVIGSPFLFGEKNKGNIYSKPETAKNIELSYNIYNQEVAFYSTANPDNELVKTPGSLDSFLLRANVKAGLSTDVTFIYGPNIGAKDKNYYEVLFGSGRFKLYKRYTGELGLVTDNIVEADLKQFNIKVDYFYTDSTTQKIKKLKTTAPAIVKEFSSVKDLSSVSNADGLTMNRDDQLKVIFFELNR